MSLGGKRMREEISCKVQMEGGEMTVEEGGIRERKIIEESDKEK